MAIENARQIARGRSYWRQWGTPGSPATAVQKRTANTNLADGYLNALEHEEPERPDNPYTRLLSAVLEDALACYRRENTWSNQSKDVMELEASRWFAGAYRCHPGFSFVDICHVLDFDPAAVRKRLVAAALPANSRGQRVSVMHALRGAGTARCGNAPRPGRKRKSREKAKQRSKQANQ